MVLTILKNISHWGSLFPIYGKIKNVPNHQPAINCHLVRWLSYLHGHSTPQPQVPVVPQGTPAFCGGSRTFQWPPCTDASKRAPWSCSCYTFFTTWCMLYNYYIYNTIYHIIHSSMYTFMYACAVWSICGHMYVCMYIYIYIYVACFSVKNWRDQIQCIYIYIYMIMYMYMYDYMYM